MSDYGLCDNCRQDDAVAECGHCNDGRGFCGVCLLGHDCKSEGLEDANPVFRRRILAALRVAK